MNIGFIGTGKIAGAIVEAICTSDLEGFNIFVSPRNHEVSSLLDAKYSKVTRLESNQAVFDSSELVFLALRPPVFNDVVTKLNFRQDNSVVSVIPFTTFDKIREVVAPAHTISRATPLPTVTTHVCPIPVYKPSEILLKVLEAIGQPFEVGSEEELHTIWTLTCLISPYYDMLDTLAKWAAKNSVNQELANKYVADMFNTLTNAAHLFDNPDFQSLSHHAATPGGLNERTAKEIQDAESHEAYIKAANGILELFKMS